MLTQTIKSHALLPQLNHKSQLQSYDIGNKSQCRYQSPTNSQSSMQQHDNQNLARQSLDSISQLQDQLARVNNMLALQHNKNQILNTQIITLTNQLHIHQSLIKQLQHLKQKSLQQLHDIRKNYQKIQQQRNNSILQLIKLRTQNNQQRGTLYINQQQIQMLQYCNRTMIDQLNYIKQALADYKNQNIMLKAQMKNIYYGFVGLRDNIIQERNRESKDNKKMLNDKIEILKTQISEYKAQIKYIQDQQKDILEYKDRLFGIVRAKQLDYQSARTQLSLSKSFTNIPLDHNNISFNTFLAKQQQYHKLLQSRQQKIKSLSLQISKLKKSNSQLTDQLTSTFIQQPNYHTNSTYVNKLLKQNIRQITQIKQIIDIKDQQIYHLKQILQLQKSTSLTKSQQIQKLNQIMKLQQNKIFNQLGKEIQELKIEKIRLNRRIQQLGQNQVQLKAEILEKDRIIMNYVQKNKEK